MGRRSKICIWPSLLLAVFGILLPLLAAAQEPEVSLADQPVNGKWDVVYADHDIGFVRGNGEIDEEAGTAKITFVHPETGQKFSLQSRSFSRTDTKITIEFKGKSPAGIGNDGLGYPQRHLIIPENTRKITASVGANSATAALSARLESDLDRLTLELTLVDQDQISGKWHYKADPFTGRDRKGFGRVGIFEPQDDGSARQSGAEIWTRAEPEIFGTFVLGNQMTYVQGFSDLPNYPHRFQDNRNREGKDSRTLVIFGKNLPSGPRAPAIFVSETKQISYEFIRYGGRIKRLDHDLDDLSKAQNALLLLLPKQVSRQTIEELDYVIVRANLKEKVLPGYHSFTMNGKKDSWLLQFGDNRADIDFVRRIRPTSAGAEGRDVEPTGNVFIPETIQIEIRTELLLDVAEIQVTVGRNGKVLRLGPTGPKIPAIRVPGRPNIFRTAPIKLIKPQGGTSHLSQATIQLGLIPVNIGPYIIPVNVNDVLTAAIAQPGLISDQPPPAMAKARLTPAQSGVDAAFKTYLRQAAQCANKEVDDWNKLSHGEAEKITKYRVFWWDTLNTSIQIGDHAAMLMMRDTFVRLMLDQHEAFGKIKSDIQVIAFRRNFERKVKKLDHAIRNIDVPGPEGDDIAFWETYATSNRSTLVRHNYLDVEPWVLKATRAALKQYQEILLNALNVAAKLDSCDDIKELLELTGRSFQAVIYQLNPRLMQLSEIKEPTLQQVWTPDYGARFRIWRIASLADQVKTFEALSKTDTKFVMASVAIGSVPFALAGSTAALMVEIAVAGFSLQNTAYDAADQYLQSQAEIEFARGTIEVLGYARLLRAKAERYSLIKAAVAIGHTAIMESVGLLIGQAIPDIFTQFQRARKITGIRRGRELLRKYDFDPDAVPANLKPRAYQEMLDFIADANWLRAASGQLDDSQIKLIRHLERLEKEALVRPRWARNFDNAIHNDLKAYYGRRDIKQLMKAAGDRVQAALRAGGRVRDEALKVLRLPQRTGKQFQRALEARLARRAEPLGEDIFKLASIKNKDAAKLVTRGRWFINFDESSGPETVFIKIRSPKGGVDQIIRGYDPATGTFFMKSAFRENVPGHIDVGLEQTISAKGFPTFLFAQLRFLIRAGVEYAGNALKQVKMKFIVNARTNAQIAWFRKTYHPDKSFQQLVDEGLLADFLIHTRSVQYAKSVINMAGYQIKRVSLVLAGEGTPLKGLAGFYKVGKDGETWKQFLKRYGLREGDLGPPAFDIKIEVEPHPEAFSKVAANDNLPSAGAAGGADKPPSEPPNSPPAGPELPGASGEDLSGTAKLNLEIPPEGTAKLDLEIPPKANSGVDIDPQNRPFDAYETVAPPSGGPVSKPPSVEPEIETVITSSFKPTIADDLRYLRNQAWADLGQVPGASDRIAGIKQIEELLNSVGPEGRALAYRIAEVMKSLGVPVLDALSYAALHHRRGVTTNLSMLQGELVAEGIIWRGTRIVPLKEFTSATGLSSLTARVAAEAAAKRLKYAPLPNEVRPGKFYPPVGF